jgi:hypothetical protein
MARKSRWFVMFCLLTIFIAGQIHTTKSDDAAKDVRYYRQQAMAAYKAKDYAAFADHLEKARQLIPDHPTILYNLAVAYTLLGKPDAALKALAQVAQMGLVYPAAKDNDFSLLKENEEFKAILKRFESNRAPVVKSEVAFTLPEKGLIPEGLAYDPIGEIFYLSSVHQRKIFSINKKGEAKVFADEGQGLWAILGMKVDAKRRQLWAVTAAVGQMVNFKKEDDGLSGILKFDLQTGKLIKRYVIADRSKKHWLGDLAINSRGDIFATDSLSPAVYTIRAGGDDIELVMAGEPLVSPQGLAFSGDEKHLFIADYSKGIFDFDPATKRCTKLAAPAGTTLLGIDGLYFHDGYLVGVQNGVNPHRLIRVRLNRSMNALEKGELLEANNPRFAEPTLGVFVNDQFYFVANSQWDLIDDNGKFAQPDKLQDVVILKLQF